MLTVENFTPELKTIVFDPTYQNIKFGDPNIIKELNNLYDSKKLKDFDNILTLECFLLHKNLEGVEWLVNKYGVDKFSIKNKETQRLIIKNANNEENLINFFIRVGIIHNVKLSEWGDEFCRFKTIG